MKRLIIILCVVAGVGCRLEVEDPDADQLDAKEASLRRMADELGVSEGSPAAASILKAVNSASQDLLDEVIGLHRLAAEGIIAHRAGADGAPGTADDDLFDDLAELDAVPYVGPYVFSQLLRYVEEQGTSGAVCTAGTQRCSPFHTRELQRCVTSGQKWAGRELCEDGCVSTGPGLASCQTGDACGSPYVIKAGETRSIDMSVQRLKVSWAVGTAAVFRIELMKGQVLDGVVATHSEYDRVMAALYRSCDAEPADRIELPGTSASRQLQIWYEAEADGYVYLVLGTNRSNTQKVSLTVNVHDATFDRQGHIRVEAPTSASLPDWAPVRAPIYDVTGGGKRVELTFDNSVYHVIGEGNEHLATLPLGETFSTDREASYWVVINDSYEKVELRRNKTYAFETVRRGVQSSSETFIIGAEKDWGRGTNKEDPGARFGYWLLTDDNNPFIPGGHEITVLKGLYTLKIKTADGEVRYQHDDDPNACFGPLRRCQADWQCCSKICVSSWGVCGTHRTDNCQTSGEWCDSDTDCCGGSCFDGTCRPGKSNGSCLRNGAVSRQAWRCCSRYSNGYQCAERPFAGCKISYQLCQKDGQCCSRKCDLSALQCE